MQTIEITAEKTGKGEVSVNYDIGDNIQELSDQFGEEVVYSRARQSIIIAIQSFLRTQIEAEKTPAEIQEAVAEWKPGVRKPAKTPEDRAREAFAAMSPEQRKAFLSDLKKKAE